MAISRPALTVASLLLPCVAHAAPLYSLTRIDPGNPGWIAWPHSLNDRGEVAGYIDRDPVGGPYVPDRPFIWSGPGSLRELAVPASLDENVRAEAINNRGEVLGSISRDMVVWMPDGTVRTIPPPAGRLWVLPRDINDAGTIVTETTDDGPGFSATVRRRADGSSDQVDGFRPWWRADVMNQAGAVAGFVATRHPFTAAVWQPDGTLRHLPSPTAERAEASAINDAGLVVGNITRVEDGRRSTDIAVWYPDGRLVLVGPPAGVDTESMEAIGINNAGEVVGQLVRSNHVGSAILWTEAEGLIELQSRLDASGTGWELNWAGDINEAGQIMALASNPQGGSFRAVLLTPVPEPAALPLTLLTLAATATRLPRPPRCRPR